MSNTLDTRPIVTTNATRDRLRPIRVSDILVLTMTLGLAIKLQQWLDGLQLSINFFGPTLVYGHQALSVIDFGISMAAVYWLVDQKKSTGKHFREPGHWVLAGSACLPLAMMAVAVFHFQSEYGFQKDEAIYTLFCLRPWVLMAATGILAGGCFRSQGIWKVCLGVLAISTTLTALAYASTSHLSNLPSPAIWSSNLTLYLLGIGRASTFVVGAVLLLVAIAQDLRKRNTRDWLHWAGVLIFFIHIMILPIVNLFLELRQWFPVGISGEAPGA